MKKIYPFLIAISALFSGQSQTLQWLNPLPHGNTLQAVSAIDSIHCFTAGGYGTVMKTSNGGLTWTVLNTGTTDELTGIKFTDTLNGWTISKTGKIFHTNNGGASWNLQYADPDTSYLTGLAFTSSLHGCVVGGGFQGGSARALTTWDGGLTWIPNILFPDSLGYKSPTDVCFADSLHGWFVADGGIYRTLDAGATWNLQRQFGSFVWLSSLSFPDTLHGWIGDVYSNSLFKTSDGGQTWASKPFQLTPAKVCFVDSLTGYVAGVDYWGGRVKQTTNGGQKWTNSTTLGMNYLYGMGFSDQNNGWVAGTSGAIFKTSGSNVSWSLQTFEYTHDHLMKCSFLENGKIGWAACENGKVIHTDDFGSTWSAPVNAMPQGHLFDIKFTDPLIGWGCGAYGHVMHSTDGGISWTSTPVSTTQHCQALSFPSSEYGFIVCDSGIIFKTIDAGLHWEKSAPFFNGDFHSVCFTDHLNGWIAAFNYTTFKASILKTIDGGNSWSSTEINSTTFFYSIFFTDLQHGWAAGTDGTVIKTEDGGVTWEFSDSQSSEDLLSVYFRDPMHGVIGGTNGLLLRTFDGGTSWEKVESGNSENIHSLYINDGEQCWSVGGNGCILTYSSIFNGIPLPNVIQPKTHITATPNPFSYRTVISYTLTEPQKVILTLYSIAGNKIQTLVNETQKSGRHSVSLDGTPLKPGVYVCQLQHGGVRQSVKLSVVPLK